MTTIKKTGRTTKAADDASPFHLSWPLAALALVALGLAVFCWSGCRKYPPATSADAYRIMDALYTACNTKNAASLDKIEAWIARDAEEGKLSPDEQNAFARIIATARDGQWDKAASEAYRFSRDQVGRGQLFETREDGRPHGSSSAAR